MSHNHSSVKFYETPPFGLCSHAPVVIMDSGPALRTAPE
jgi:hypothetical protein